MASPAPPGVESLAEALERQIGEILARGAALEDLPSSLAEVAGTSAEALGGMAAAGEAGSAVEIAVSAAAAVVDFAMVAVAILIVGLVFLLAWIETSLADLIPPSVPWLGTKWRPLVHFAFDPVDALRTKAAQFLAQELAGALHAFGLAVQWAISHELPQQGTPLAVINQQLVEPVHHEVDVLWGWVQSLAGEVTSLRQASISGAGGPGSGVGVPGGRLDQLDAQVSMLRDELNHLTGTVGQLVASQQHQDQEIATLRSIVGGVRAVTIGAQDVITSLDHLRTTIEAIQAQQGAELAHHTAELAQLAPLLSLLYLGERGLDNLRKLEQNPCQCPRLPGFNPLELDAFGVYEFLTNG